MLSVVQSSREKLTLEGTRLWDKLLIGAGSVSKSLTSKLKDEGYNSDSDEEGVDTHVIKALKDYYQQKGQGIPVWLGGTGSNVRPQVSVSRYESNDGANPVPRTGKVSLKGIYEQAAERSSSQQTSPRRGLSRTGSNYREQVSDTYAPRRSEESARSATSARGQMSAGERFREKMKTNRTMSSQSSMSASGTSDSVSLQQTRSSRGSLEVPRDGSTMANRLKRGGTSGTTQGRF